MGIEIERKFLVANDGWKIKTTQENVITQGYLCLQPERTVRIRLTDIMQLPDDAPFATLTIKGKTQGISRKEFEYDIPAKDFVEMLDLCIGHPILKKRFTVPHSGVIWEIDVFEGSNAGLVIAEVELSDEDQQIDLPDWVGREVSDIPTYFNSNLVRMPYQFWKDRPDFEQ